MLFKFWNWNPVSQKNSSKLLLDKNKTSIIPIEAVTYRHLSMSIQHMLY